VNKIIFLDIDGVLLTQSSLIESRQKYLNGETEYQYDDKFDLNCVNNLKNILKEVPDAEIVISSSWRILHSLEELREYFSDYGINPYRIIDVTPKINRTHQRGFEQTCFD